MLMLDFMDMANHPGNRVTFSMTSPRQAKRTMIQKKGTH